MTHLQHVIFYIEQLAKTKNQRCRKFYRDQMVDHLTLITQKAAAEFDEKQKAWLAKAKAVASRIFKSRQKK